MKIGCHVSISGGAAEAIDRAELCGAETFQIFTQNQRRWKSVHYAAEAIALFHERRQQKFGRAKLVAHASYLINMCASKADTLEKSRRALVEELQRCDQLGLDFLVIHPGSHGGNGAEWGMALVAETLNTVLSSYQAGVKILLENTAGQGSALGSRFSQLQNIIEITGQNHHIGVCIDTCHAFAAGYPLHSETGFRDTISELFDAFAPDTVAVWHLNDSLMEQGSRRDRHAPIGDGRIGLGCFERLINFPEFANTPGILEIPGGMDKFRDNIALLKRLRI